MTARVPPHDLVAERALLACVLLDDGALDEIADLLAPPDFFSRANDTTFGAMLALHTKGEPVDTVTVRAWLADRSQLERAGGDDALLALTEHIPTTAHVEAYARRIAGLARIRATIAAAHEIAAAGYGDVADIDAYLADSEAKLAIACRARVESTGPVDLKTCVIEVTEELTDETPNRKGAPVPSRFTRVDRFLGGGVRAGELILIAGRPGMGKSAIGLNLALSLAAHGPGIFFSLEMSRQELTRRAIASEGRIDGGRMRTRQLSRNDWESFTAAGGALCNLPMQIDATGGATLAHVRAALRRQRARSGLSWAVLDYLQLMGLPGRENREKEIGDVSRALKALAKELEVPLLVLSQLNRDVEKRPAKDRRPILADLRDSGSLEQDADVVLFVHREELYQPNNVEVRGLAELVCRKQRGGALGTIGLRYFAEYTRFEELAAEDTEAAPMPRIAASGGYTRSYDDDNFEDP